MAVRCYPWGRRRRALVPSFLFRWPMASFGSSWSLLFIFDLLCKRVSSSSYIGLAVCGFIYNAGWKHVSRKCGEPKFWQAKGILVLTWLLAWLHMKSFPPASHSLHNFYQLFGQHGAKKSLTNILSNQWLEKIGRAQDGMNQTYQSDGKKSQSAEDSNHGMRGRC
jgi:hypothetical protein